MHKSLTLIRHCTLDRALDGCYVGRMDVPLCEKGKLQAVQLAQLLGTKEIDALWCSPALRARQTSTPIAEQLKLACHIVNELSEVDFGRWEGMTFEQIKAADPLLVNEWAEMPGNFRFPEGESQVEFQLRIDKVAKQITSCEHHNLAVVSHGGVIRALLCRLLGWPSEDYLKVEIQRGGIATLDLYSKGAVLTGLYDEKKF